MVLPPGPRLPSLAQTALFSLVDPFGSHLWAQKRYGNVFRLRNLVMGDLAVVCEPDLIREIFTAPDETLAAGEANAPLGTFVGRHSVLVLDGPDHIRQRRIMQPSFHGTTMRRYAETMREATDAELDGWRSGEERSLLPAMQRITLEVILRTVFGLDDRTRYAPLREGLRELMSYSSSRTSFLLLHPALQRDLGGLSPWARTRRSLERVDQLIYQEIRARRAARMTGQETGGDVLSLLLAARSEDGHALSDVELRDELMTLLMAGHETTATSLAWAFERLLAHPHILGRVQDELDRVLGTSQLEEPQLAQLPYLDATLHEVLRMRPPVPFVGRCLKRPYRLGPYSLPAGWMVVPSAIGVHFRADLYPEPHRFCPERFLDTRVDRYRWLPFGGGTRRCLGMAFALLEMKVVLAVMLPRVELALVRAPSLRIVPRSFLLAPYGGTEVRVRSVAPRKTRTSLLQRVPDNDAQPSGCTVEVSAAAQRVAHR